MSDAAATNGKTRTAESGMKLNRILPKLQMQGPIVGPTIHRLQLSAPNARTERWTYNPSASAISKPSEGDDEARREGSVIVSNKYHGVDREKACHLCLFCVLELDVQIKLYTSL